MDKPKNTSNHARALSKLGAARGGRARAETLTDGERRSIARNAALARWKKDFGREGPDDARTGDVVDDHGADESTVVVDQAGRPVPDDLPYVMFKGTLPLGDLAVACYVLNDGRRVIPQREIIRVLSGGTPTGGLQRYLSNNPLTVEMLTAFPTIRCRVPGTQFTSYGFEATFLVDVCSKYLEARERRLLKRNQLEIARRAEAVIRACAKIGIIALIDEATGYQTFRKKRELQIKFQAFIADEMQEWAKTFPDEFWIQLARLEGIHYSTRSRPLRWGKYVMAFVYDAIDPDIGKWLRENNPDPHHRKNHHQWLKSFGKEKLREQLTKVVTIMQLCTDMNDFRAKFAHVFKKSPLQLSFENIEAEEVAANVSNDNPLVENPAPAASSKRNVK